MNFFLIEMEYKEDIVVIRRCKGEGDENRFLSKQWGSESRQEL